MKTTAFRALLAPLSLALVLAFFAPGCSESPVEVDTPQRTELRAPTVAPAPAPTSAVTDFGDAIAKAQRTRNGIETTLFDTRGTEIARLSWNGVDGKIALSTDDAPGLAGSDDGAQLTLKGTTYAVYYYYHQVQKALALQKTTDLGDLAGYTKAPGCDFIPDFLETKCIRDCCDAHDACWAANDCGYLSWIGVGGWDCIKCNLDVVLCIGSCVIDLIIDAVGPILGW